MPKYHFATFALLAICHAGAAAANNLTVNSAGDAGSGSCATTCTLRDAIGLIASGGTIDFAPSMLPAKISLTNLLYIEKSMNIHGPGAEKLTISAGESSQVFLVSAPAGVTLSLAISGVTIQDGKVWTPDASSAAAGSGDDGTIAGNAIGGCIQLLAFNLASSIELTIQQADIRNCTALGGNGGNGGSGTPSSGGLNPGGPGGRGARGGIAQGAAIGVVPYAGSGPVDVTLIGSSITGFSAISGNGGRGGDGGGALFKGSGGDGGMGGGVYGGAVSNNGLSDSHTVLLNTTIIGGTTQSGNGGAGGNGDPGVSGLPGGRGGDGGYVEGADVYFYGTGNVAFSTLTAAAATAGSEGAGGTGKDPGSPGFPGEVSGTAIAAASPGPVQTISPITSSVIMDGTDLCYGTLYASGANVDEDGSCGASIQAPTLAALFRHFDANATRPALMPYYGSPLIGAATSCNYTNDPGDPPLAEDEYGTPRPQGAQCDLGAIEADYIFANNFE